MSNILGFISDDVISIIDKLSTTNKIFTMILFRSIPYIRRLEISYPRYLDLFPSLEYLKLSDNMLHNFKCDIFSNNLVELIIDIGSAHLFRKLTSMDIISGSKSQSPIFYNLRYLSLSDDRHNRTGKSGISIDSTRFPKLVEITMCALLIDNISDFQTVTELEIIDLCSDNLNINYLIGTNISKLSLDLYSDDDTHYLNMSGISDLFNIGDEVDVINGDKIVNYVSKCYHDVSSQMPNLRTYSIIRRTRSDCDLNIFAGKYKNLKVLSVLSAFRRIPDRIGNYGIEIIDCDKDTISRIFIGIHPSISRMFPRSYKYEHREDHKPVSMIVNF